MRRSARRPPAPSRSPPGRRAASRLAPRGARILPDRDRGTPPGGGRSPQPHRRARRRCQGTRPRVDIHEHVGTKDEVGVVDLEPDLQRPRGGVELRDRVAHPGRECPLSVRQRHFHGHTRLESLRVHPEDVRQHPDPPDVRDAVPFRAPARTSAPPRCSSRRRHRRPGPRCRCFRHEVASAPCLRSGGGSSRDPRVSPSAAGSWNWSRRSAPGRAPPRRSASGGPSR